MVESERVPGKGIIRASNEKLSKRVSKNGRIHVYTGKWSNPGEYREKGIIRASNEKLSSQVLQNCRISVSSEKWYNLGEYREKVGSERVSKNCPDEY